MLINCKSNNSVYVNNDFITSLYFNDVRKIPMLSQQEERELLVKYNFAETEEEKLDARNKLVEGNLRFVISIAKKLGNADNFTDLVNEGNMGLIKAIEKFDITKTDTKLCTYAVSWITVYIQNYQREVQNSVVVPNANKLYGFVNKITNEFIKQNERNPLPEEVAELIEKRYDFHIVNLEDVELGKVISINEKYSTSDEDNDTVETSSQFTSKTATNNIQDDIDMGYKRDKINHFLNRLTERERTIIIKSFGIGCETESFDMIGMDMKLCKERVRQLYVGALKKMQDSKETYRE